MHPIFIPWRAGTSRHRPATPTTVARTTTAEGRRRDVGLGLVPSQGSGVGYRRPLNPSINQCTQFSYLGVPAPAGTGTPTTVARTITAEGRRRDVGLGLVPSQGSGVGHRLPLNPSINQCIQFSCLGVPAPAGTGTPTTVARTTTAEGRRRDVGLGLVPSQGSGVGYRRPLNPSINQCTQFSYLGVPAPAGTSDWCENRRPREPRG